MTKKQNLNENQTDAKTQRSVSEIGHLKNVTQFDLLIEYCTNFGGIYVPANERILIPALSDKKTAAEEAVHAVNDIYVPLKSQRAVRKSLFAPLDGITTRVMASLEASGASKDSIAQAATIARKIHGLRAADSPKARINGVKNPEAISSSQQSFDRQADFFRQLIKHLESEPKYNPNEPELSIAELTAYQSKLVAANKAVNVVLVPYNRAIIARDETLYAPGTGLIATAALVKQYVKSLFGAASEEYKLVNALRFRKD